MNAIQKLQAKYAAGKITKEQYEQQLADLLKDEEVTQEEYDEAADYDPEDQGEPLLYSQSDVNDIVKRKAVGLVRKALKDAGIAVDAPNKDLLEKVVELVQAGNGKSGDEAAQEVVALKKQIATMEKAAGQYTELQIENSILKAAGKYDPYNTTQVVRALKADYTDLLEYDEETGQLLGNSVDKAIQRVAKAEPNLFKNPEGSGADDTDPNKGGEFKGKGPGGGTGSGQKKDLAKQKAVALEMLGIKTDK